ncbi:helix-turn-helix transcriptional regulator [Phyllobacterium phragmitis]|nr:helix-turn-helix domain-containing protein [Phyllobacterium phragmitis]
METSLSNEAKRYLRTDEAALFLGLSVRTMEKHRCYGTGPIYRKLGGRVVYALADLEHWANRGILSSTSDSTAIRAAIPKYRTNSPQVANDRRSANNDSCD